MAWRCVRGFLQSEDEGARGGTAEDESKGEGQLQLPRTSAAGKGEEEAIKATLEAQVKERNHQVARLEEQLKKQDQRVKELEAALKDENEATVEAQAKERNHQVARLKEQLKKQDQRVKELEAALKGESEATLEAHVKERSHQEARLKEQLKMQDQRGMELESAVKDKSKATVEAQAKERNHKVARLEEQLKKQDQRVKELEAALKDESEARTRLELAVAEEWRGWEELAAELREALGKLAERTREASEDTLAAERDAALRDLEVALAKIKAFAEDHHVQSAAGQAHLSLPGAEHRETAQRLEARTDVQKLEESDLSPHTSFKDMGAQLGIVASHKTTTWRNIRYGSEGDWRLDIYEKPDQRSGKIDSVPLGYRLSVERTLNIGNDVWLQLGSGTYRNYYVCAQSNDTVQCVEMEKWADSPGQIPYHAYAGQDYPDIGMYTEGYAGSHDVCLVSASGDAFWREINLEMLFRDIATATVFEEEWGGSENFTDWVAYYAANVVLHTGVQTERMKRCIVTVKPSARWSRYQCGKCIGPKIKKVKGDLGRAQIKECTWLFDNRQRLQIDWSQVEFVTAFSFLKTHCKWTDADCRRVAASKLFDLANRWESLSSGQRQHEFQRAVWWIDEAFDGRPIPKLLGTTIIRLLAGSCMEREALICACDYARTAVDIAKVLGEDGNRHALVHMAESGVPFAKQLMKDLGMVLPVDTLYALGDANKGGRSASSASRYDPALGAWEPLPPMAEARSGLAAAALGGRVYALGGRGGGGYGGGFTLASAESYDPALGAWEPLPDMAEAREGLAAAALGGRVYALGSRGGGGYGGRILASAARYDPALGAWEPLPPMAKARCGLAAAALGGRVYALGGYGGGGWRVGTLASVEQYDPELGAWVALPPMAERRCNFAVAAVAALDV